MKKTTLLISLAISSIFTFSQNIHVSEDFNLGILPSNWVNTIVSGSTSWQFGVNGSSTTAGNQNLNGTSFVYFDDDFLGQNSLNNTVELLTPVFDNSAEPITTLEFDYNFREFGSASDSFNVHVFDGTNWVRVFSRTTNDCGNYISSLCLNNYPHTSIDISAYANSNCQVRFTYHDGDDWAWYVGIDNVEISSPFQNDIQISEIISPKSSCGLTSSETITVKIKNVGSSPASGFGVAVNIDNGAQLYIENVTATVAPQDSLNYTFTSTADLSTIKQYAIQAYTQLLNDANTSNDTTTVIVDNQNGNTPTFIDDFEGVNTWIVSGNNASWELGTPSNNGISSATSGINAFVTDLDGNYNSSELSYLTSPCFNFSGDTLDPIVSFDLNYITETDFDLLTFESSIDNGLSWQLVNAAPNASNWYNSPVNYWSGNSNGWLAVENTLAGLSGEPQVLFRFRFQSDASGNFEGVGIDNFSVRYPIDTDLSLNALLFPTVSATPLCGLGSSTNIVVEVENKGFTQVDTTYFFYTVNNGPIVSDTLIASILPNSTTQFTYTTPFNFPSSTTSSVDLWISTPRDGFQQNDSLLNRTITNPITQIDSLPFFEDFESFIPNSTSNNLARGWTRNTASGFNWRVRPISTSSGGTGPDIDHTPAPGVNYIYTEASGALPGSIAILESPCIDLTTVNSALLEFWSHRFGNTMSDLFVDVYDGSQWINISVLNTTPQTSSADAYSPNLLNLNAFKGRIIKIRFRTGTWIGFSSDMAIDDVFIYEPLPNDIQVNQLVSPFSGCNPGDIVTVELENSGSTDITTPFLITLQWSGPFGSLTSTDTVNSSFLIGDKKNFTFSVRPNLFIPWNYVFNITTFLLGDQNPNNNNLISTVTNTAQFSNYTETFTNFSDGECPPPFGSPSNDFDTLMTGWEINSSGGGSEWQVHDIGGCNNQGPDPNGLTGPSSDHTSSTGKFIYVESSDGNGTTQLITPCINFAIDSIAGISFWYHAYGNQIDSLTVDVLVNGIWNALPNLTIAGQQQTSSSDPWILITDTFHRFAGQILTFRFNYSYNGGFGGRGDFAIDDISFNGPIITDIEAIDKEADLINLYPNPNKGNFNLIVSKAQIGKAYQILDIKGAIVKTASISSIQSHIELNNIEKGIYFLRIEGVSETKKIVIY